MEAAFHFCFTEYFLVIITLVVLWRSGRILQWINLVTGFCNWVIFFLIIASISLAVIYLLGLFHLSLILVGHMHLRNSSISLQIFYFSEIQGFKIFPHNFLNFIGICCNVSFLSLILLTLVFFLLFTSLTKDFSIFFIFQEPTLHFTGYL